MLHHKSQRHHASRSTARDVKNGWMEPRAGRDPAIKAELENILRTYEQDNCSAWDMQPDGQYIRRHPAAGEAPRGAQQVFIERSGSR